MHIIFYRPTDLFLIKGVSKKSFEVFHNLIQRELSRAVVHDLSLFLLAMALVLSIYFTVRKISVPAKNYDVEVSETQEMHNKKSRILASNDFFPVKLHEEHLC